jgi:lipid-binding SYLF domain-containing protein
MSHFKKAMLTVVMILITLPCQSMAFTETVSGAVSDAGKWAKGVGKTMGIGVTAEEIDQDVTASIKTLMKNSEAAAKLAKTAKAVLVYPRILKGGLGIGGMHGNGALRQNGKTIGYYNIVAGSYGLQIGGQAFGYAMFFMDDTGLDYLLNNNAGWEVGVGPSVVIVDEGMAKTMNNTTISESVYVFTFSQKGLMAGMGIQGSKISKTTPK